MGKQKRLEAGVLTLLKNAGLYGQPYTLADFIQGMGRVFPEVVFEPFIPVGNLRAGVFKVEGTTVIFYPSSKSTSLFAALYSVSHEIAHLYLGHRLVSPGTTVSRNDAEEEEAERVARIIVRLRFLAGQSEPTTIHQYFQDVGR